MAPQATALTTKTGNRNSIPGTHIIERQTYSYKLSSDFYSGVYVYMCVYTQTIQIHIHTVMKMLVESVDKLSKDCS